MAKLGINTGSSPNDGLGDSLLSGAIKINSNFNEIYNAIGNGTSITNTIAFANTAFSLSGSPNINVGFATISNLDVGVGGSSLIVTSDGIIAIGTDSTLYDIEIFEKNISIPNSTITAGDSFIYVQSAEVPNLFTYNAYVSSAITATSYYGAGENLTGIITSILAGSNVSISQTGGVVTIDSSGGGGSESYWTKTIVGIHTLSNVGIGITSPGYDLDVNGDINFTGTLYQNSSPFVASRWTTGVGTNIYRVNGNVGIGTSVPGSKLTVTDGNIAITGSGNITLPNISRLNLGNNGSNDSSIYFDGSDLRIDSATQTRLGNGSYNYITATANSSVNLYHGTGQKKLETTSSGIQVTGDVVSSGIITGSNVYASGSLYGAGQNITGIVTSIVAGTNIAISASSGQITIDASTDSSWRTTTAGINTLSNVGIGTTNPTSKLFVNGVANINGGLVVSGISTFTAGRIQFGTSGENIRIGNLSGGNGSVSNISIGDQSLATLNSSGQRNIGLGQFSLYNVTSGKYNIAIGDRSGENISTGSSNVILGSYNGNSGGLDIRTLSNNIVLSDGSGNIRQYINSAGNVGLGTVNPTSRLTVNGNVLVSGILTATIPASNLTGALPAIDGSALIGVVGSGSGIIIQDDATPVGTAGTINFGSNISVSFASGIATVSGASSVSEATTAYGLSGTPNLNVGVLTATDFTASRSTLSNTIISGLCTATYGIRFADDAGAGFSTYVTNIGQSYIIGFQTGQGYFQDKYYQFAASGPNFVLNNIGIGTTNATSKLTVSGDVNVSGALTASSFSGSASGLTNIPSGQLTGALPAIDGSALLNVTASGTGVVVEDDTVNVGSATTIDFGTGLDVAFSGGVATITASGGSLQSRTTVTGVTTSIANNGIGNTNISGFKSYALLKVGLSTDAWIRLYTDSTSRANDASRSLGEDPLPGSGVIAEVSTSGISTTQIISPFVIGGNLDNPADTIIYAAITNLSGSTQAITANLTILQLEA